MSHPSLKQDKVLLENNIADYERLELLGDSIINFLITEMLFKKFSNSNEGGITKIKAFLVSNQVLSKISEQISLSKFIIMTKGEEHSGGRQNPNNLENALEALIAAIYLDGGVEATRKIVLRLWKDHLVKFDYDSIDPKTSLQEWSQKYRHQVPEYTLLSKSGPDHSPMFVIKCIVGEFLSEGSAHSIKMAEKIAAKKMLDKIRQN